MLGWPAAHGRTFTAEDDRPGAEPVVILGDEIFQRRYTWRRLDRRTARPRQRPAAHGRRRHAAELRVPREPETVHTARAARARPAAGRARAVHARPAEGWRDGRARGQRAHRDGRAARRTNIPARTTAGAPSCCRSDEEFIPDDVELIIWTMMARGHARAAHRVRQHREPAHRARVGAAAGDLDPRRARRRALAHRPPASDRGHAARADGRADRHGARGGRPPLARRRDARRTTFRTSSIGRSIAAR